MNGPSVVIRATFIIAHAVTVSSLFAQTTSNPRLPPATSMPTLRIPAEGITSITTDTRTIVGRPEQITINGTGTGDCGVRVYPGDGPYESLGGTGFPRQVPHTYKTAGDKTVFAFAGAGCPAKWAWSRVAVGTSRIPDAPSPAPNPFAGDPLQYMVFETIPFKVLMVKAVITEITQYVAYCKTKTAEYLGTTFCTDGFGRGWWVDGRDRLTVKVWFGAASGVGQQAYAGIILVPTSYPQDGWWWYWSLLYGVKEGFYGVAPDRATLPDPAIVGQLAGWPIPVPTTATMSIVAPAAGSYSMWVRIFMPGETQPAFALIGDLHVKQVTRTR